MSLRLSNWVNILLAGLLSTISLFSQDVSTIDLDSRNIRHWDIFSGLPSDSITSLHQDQLGNIWLGTYDTVATFDGRNFESFDQRNTPGLLTHSASVFLEDENRLWIGSSNEGLALLENGEFTTYTIADGLLSNSISSLALDESGKLWIGTNRGLQMGPVEDFALPRYPQEDPFSHRQVNHLLFHHGLGLVASCSDGGIYLNSQENPQLVEQSHSLRVARMVLWKDDKILLGVRGGQVFSLDNQGIRELTMLNSHGGSIRDIHYSPERESLWIASSRALLHQDSQGNLTSLEAGHPMLDYTPKAVLEDREGNLWIGTRSGGLFALSASPFSGRRTGAALGNVTVNSLAPSPEGEIWIGSDQGLHLWTNDTLEDHELSDLLRGIRVKHVFISQETLYISTLSDMGLVIYRNGSVEYLNKDAGMPSNTIKMSLIDSRGVLWISTSNGVVRLEDQQLTIYNKDSGFPSDEIYQIMEDSQQRIWISTVHDGLICLERNGAYQQYNQESGLPGDMVFSCYEDLQGRFWISTAAGCFILERNGEIVPFSFRNGLPYLYTYNAIPHEDRVYFTSVAGLSYGLNDNIRAAAGTDRGYAELRHLGIQDGLLASPNALSWPSFMGDNLWIPTHRGASLFHPLEDNAPGVSEEFHIKAVHGDTGRFQQMDQSYQAMGLQESMEVYYAYPSLQLNHRALFSYRLLGYQNEWSSPSANDRAVFTQIKPGSYRFELRMALSNSSQGVEEVLHWSPALSREINISRTPIQWIWIVLSILLIAVISLILFLRWKKKKTPSMYPAKTGDITHLQKEYGLTNREMEFIHALNQGLRDKEIANNLNCAVSTVSNSFSRIYRKTSTKGRSDLVKMIHSVDYSNS